MDLIIKTLITTTILSYLLAWIYWEINLRTPSRSTFKRINKYHRLEVFFKRCGIISGGLLLISLFVDLIIKSYNNG